MSNQELKLCPFCGKAMQFRAALWPSDGDQDGIIHAGSTDCPLSVFSNGTTDESIIAAWNRRVPAVKVKALEWGPYPNPVFAGPEVAVAHVGFKHHYQVQRDPYGFGFIAWLAPQYDSLWWESKGHALLDDAKAAAQADYEQRILAALDTSEG